MSDTVTVRVDLGDSKLDVDVPIEEIERRIEFFDGFDPKAEVERLSAMLPGMRLASEGEEG